jgi:DNA-binding beta-propeller fold protein YncE
MFTAALTAAAIIAGAVLAVKTVSGGSRSAGGTPRASLAVKVGGFPVGLAVDESADTVYVAAARAGLVMLKATACSPSIKNSGCSARHAPAGGTLAVSVAVDRPAHTIYVANGLERTITVINTATCNAITTRGCSSPAALIRLHGAPQALALDLGTGTLYADMFIPPAHQLAFGAPEAPQLAVISTSACNASAADGCRAALTIPLPGQGLHAAIAVDQTTGTIYAAEASKLAVINGRACGAGNISGCAKTLATIPVYGYITGISAGAGRVYVTSPGTGTVTVLRTGTCSAVGIAGCAQLAFIRAGAGPSAAVTDPPAHTLYVTNAATNHVSMLDPAACGGIGHGGCSLSPSAFPVGAAPGPAAVDPATRTLYVGNLGSWTVSLIGIAACGATTRSGCPTQPPAGTPAIRHTPYSCDPEIAAYQSGQPAASFMRSSVRVAAGTTGGETWSVWARKGVFDPNGIEQGGLVLGGRWYALCSAPLSAGADASIEMIDTPGHGTVYGYVQHTGHVSITLAAPGPLPHPTSVPLRGTTFFIETLPRPACTYPTLTLHGRAPGWGGVTSLTLGTCEPHRLVDIPSNQGTWGFRPG